MWILNDQFGMTHMMQNDIIEKYLSSRNGIRMDMIIGKIAIIILQITRTCGDDDEIMKMDGDWNHITQYHEGSDHAQNDTMYQVKESGII